MYVALQNAPQGEAVNAQPQEEEKNLCGICFGGFEDYKPMEGQTVKPDDYELFLLNGCSHMYHKACIGQFCEVAIKDGRFPMVCPEVDCNAKLREVEIRRLVSDKMFQMKEDKQMALFAAKD